MDVLIAPLAFVLLLAALALRAAWSGPRACRNGRDPVDRRVGGEPGRLQRNSARGGGIRSICVCLDVPRAFRFILRKEGFYDRVAKALRLSREPQLSHGPFDDAFYLDAEDPLAARLLEGTPELRTRLATGLARVTERGACFSAIACSDGRLHIHLRTLGMSEVDVEHSAHEAALWASPLLEAMRKVRAEPSETTLLRRRALEARLPPFVALPLAVAILVGIAFAGPEALYENGDLLPPALAVGGAMLLAHVAWAWKRTFPAQRHRRALEWIFLGWPAFTALAFFLFLALRTTHVLSGPGDRSASAEAGPAQPFAARRAKQSPDQVASIAQILKSTSPLFRPKARTTGCVRSDETPEAFFGQAIQSFPFGASTASAAGKRSSSAAREATKRRRTLAERARRVTRAPSGRGPRTASSPFGAPRRRAEAPGPIPSFLGRGVPE